MKILMVCLGNICRSPLAEGILKEKAKGIDVFIDSAGTASYHIGSLPDSRSIEIANSNGIDISDQRARQFTESDFDAFDKIYAMDTHNYSAIISLARTDQDAKKVDLILNEVNPGASKSVPDPYYGHGDGFKLVFEMLSQACEIIVKRL